MKPSSLYKRRDFTLSKTKKATAQDPSTEEKIKSAAKKLFTKNGYAAIRTRDIAEESGINLALLNYYFRSKKKLFELVMKENIHLFLGAMIENINNTPQTFDEQLDFIVCRHGHKRLSRPSLLVIL